MLTAPQAASIELGNSNDDLDNPSPPSLYGGPWARASDAIIARMTLASISVAMRCIVEPHLRHLNTSTPQTLLIRVAHEIFAVDGDVWPLASWWSA